ncbi:MAG: peroxiredoxin [Proteobacteria bacterium]|nr:peroxiredoxin [Pseudomonadota bacterium]MDA1064817.1 peroxiredoxin [Pseudomonadota bacterium]
MNKISLAVLGLAFMALPAIAALEAGDTAPKFELRASLDGEEFDYSLSEALEAGPVVVYFYPSAYTGGCNIQAHEFAVNMEKFKAAGASVIGVSLDSIERLNDFSADPEYCAGELSVASDANGDVAASFKLSVREAPVDAKDSRGVEIGHNMVERTTFIVTSDGEIAVTIGGISPMENVQKSLEAVQSLN